MTILDGLEDPHDRLLEKGKGTCRRTGDNASIDWSDRWRAAPNHVAFLRIRSRNTPQIIAVIRKLFCQLQTEAAMDIGGNHRVMKVIRILVTFAAEIKPGL